MHYKYKIEFDPRKCKCCNNEFVPQHHAQHHCSTECRATYNRDRSRERDRQERMKRKGNKSLSQLQREARMLGMSYGMYVAQMQKGAV